MAKKKNKKDRKEQGVVESFSFEIKSGSKLDRKLRRIEEETKKKFPPPKHGGVILPLNPRDVEKIVEDVLDRRRIRQSSL
jgi:hypothetical protein